MSLGKIRSIRIGAGGYQDAQFGVTFYLETKDGSVMDFWGMWATERMAGTQWTEADRIQRIGEEFWRLHNLMTEAKVADVNQLVGKPVDVTFEGMRLKTWRILTEVL